jgi:hypothetical protein
VFAPDGCPTVPPEDTFRVPGAENLTLYKVCVDSVREARSPAAVLAIRFALSQIGTPYSQARRNEPHIYDCSSFVSRAYQSAGVPIAYPATPNLIDGPPHANAAVTDTMVDAAWATPVTPETAKPGDLVFFAGAKPPNGHVGMLLADGVMVHTNASGDVAHVNPLDVAAVTAWRAVDPTKVHIRTDPDRVALTSAARDAHTRYLAASITLARIELDVANARAERAVARRQVDAARRRQTAAARAEAAARAHMQSVAVTSYVQNANRPSAASLISTSSPMEVARVNEYASTLGDSLDDAITKYVHAKETAAAEARALERKVAAISARLRDLQLEARRATTALANALGDPSAPILGPSKLTPAELVAWYRSTGRHETTGVPVDVIAKLYVDEGRLAGVRGDVAFAEAVLDTGGFTFPATGALSGHDNGLVLAGGCDTCRVVPWFASAADAVRAHVQLLRTYADPDVNSTLIGAPLVQPNVLDAQLKGTIASWRQLPGMAQTAPDYGDAIMRVYDEITAWAGAHPVAGPIAAPTPTGGG